MSDAPQYTNKPNAHLECPLLIRKGKNGEMASLDNVKKLGTVKIRLL